MGFNDPTCFEIWSLFAYQEGCYWIVGYQQQYEQCDWYNRSLFWRPVYYMNIAGSLSFTDIENNNHNKLLMMKNH